MSKKPKPGGSASARARVDAVRIAFREHSRRKAAESRIRELVAQFPGCQLFEAVTAAMPAAGGSRSKEELTRLQDERTRWLNDGVLALYHIAQGMEETVGLDLVGHLAVTAAQRRALRILELAAFRDEGPQVFALLWELVEEAQAENAEGLFADLAGIPVAGGESVATWFELTERLVPTLLSGAGSIPDSVGSSAQPVNPPPQRKVEEKTGDPQATSPSPPSAVTTTQDEGESGPEMPRQPIVHPDAAGQAPLPGGQTKPASSPTSAKRPRRHRPTQESTNVLVAKWFEGRDFDPTITRDRIATETGCHGSYVSDTPAWKAFAILKDRSSRTEPRTVPLTDGMVAAIPDSCEMPDELLDLIGEQAADKAREESYPERRQSRRNRPS